MLHGSSSTCTASLTLQQRVGASHASQYQWIRLDRDLSESYPTSTLQRLRSSIFPRKAWRRSVPKQAYILFRKIRTSEFLNETCQLWIADMKHALRLCIVLQYSNWRSLWSLVALLKTLLSSRRWLNTNNVEMIVRQMRYNLLPVSRSDSGRQYTEGCLRQLGRHYW